MFGDALILIGVIALFVSGVKKVVRDTYFKASDVSDFPFWLDSEGNNRWKHNDKIIRNVTWDSENHLIITDKNFNDINWTWKNIEDYLNKHPNAIIQYGKDTHNKEKIPGVRYIAKVNGQYKYYVVIRYGKMQYYMDIATEKIVKPVPECLKYEREAKEQGYEYCTEESIKQGKEILESMDTLDRRKHICYLGKSAMKFNATKSLRHKI